MATQSTTHTHIRNTFVPEGWGRKIGVVAAGLAIAGTVAVTAPWSGSDDVARSADPVGSAGAPERSVLLDGEAFDLAVSDVLTDVLRQTDNRAAGPAGGAVAAGTAPAGHPTSALVDAEEFDIAVADVVAAMEVPRSALLDAEAFEVAVARVVSQLGDTQSVLLDAEAFEIAVAEAVESALGS